MPDAPAMAWRDPVSNLTFVAPGDSRGTWSSVGHGLSNVRHNCSMMIFNYSGPRGWEEPADDFASHEWLYAPFVVPPVKAGEQASVFMLVHNEYHGWEHRSEGLCNASVNVKSRCWYNSVTLSVSHDGGRHFRHAATPPAHVVAAPDYIYVPNQQAYGVFSPSQIVTNPKDGFHYSFPVFISFNRTKTPGIEHTGVCSMRTKTPGNPASWRYWTGVNGSDGYTGHWSNPYSNSPANEKLQTQLPPTILKFVAGFSQPVPRYLPKYGIFVMVGYMHFAHTSRHHFGISTAPEPWGPWSRAVPIPADINPAHDEPENRKGIYPSLLDPNSGSLNYDTLEGLDVWVYWVQGRNKTTVHAPDMARDLVRQPVRLLLGTQAVNK